MRKCAMRKVSSESVLYRIGLKKLGLLITLLSCFPLMAGNYNLTTTQNSYSGHQVKYSYAGAVNNSYNIVVPNGYTAKVRVETTDYVCYHNDKTADRFYVKVGGSLVSAVLTQGSYVSEKTVTSSTTVNISCYTYPNFWRRTWNEYINGKPVPHFEDIYYWDDYFVSYQYKITVNYSKGSGPNPDPGPVVLGDWSFSKTSDTFSANGGKGSVTVTCKEYLWSQTWNGYHADSFMLNSGYDGKIYYSGPDGLSIDSISWNVGGDKSKSAFNYSVTSNTGTRSKTWIVTVEYRGLSQTVVISQAARNSCTVTLKVNGGSLGGKSNKVYVTKGKAVGTLTKPTRSGYTFKGWYTKKSGGLKITTKTKITKNVTYYARWAANKYTIKFNKNGGKGKMKTQSATYGKAVTLRANAFKKSKYKFAGWAKKKGGKVAYKNKAKVKNLTATNGKTVTLYAVWKKAKSSSVKSAASVSAAAMSARSVSAASSSKSAAVPAWAVGTFYGGDEDALTTITVSKAGKVSGKVLFADGGRWTIVGSASGQRIAAVVTDASGLGTSIALVITRTDDGHCCIESDDGSISAEN